MKSNKSCTAWDHEMVECDKCKELKPIIAFDKDYDKACGSVYCKVCSSNRHKIYMSNPSNRDKVNKHTKKSREINKQHYEETNKAWRAKNKHRISAFSAKRRASFDKRVPKWLNKRDWVLIREFYKRANDLTEKTGVFWEVDHIIPLRGKIVSGLHVPSNLKVITKADNIKKSNKF